MRIRIALAAAVAATSMTTLLDVAAPAAGAATTSPAASAAVPSPNRGAPTGVSLTGKDRFILTIFSASGGASALSVTHQTMADHLLWVEWLATVTRLGVSVPPAPPPTPAPPVTDATSTTTADWQCIRVHESGDVYNDATRPSGAYGILRSTWQSFGFYGWPYQAAPALQDALALKLYNLYGWAPWSSRYACGL